MQSYHYLCIFRCSSAVDFCFAAGLIIEQGNSRVKIFQSHIYLPALLGGSVAISILWRQVFGIEGIFNQFLSYLGFSEEITKISWISNPKFSLHTLIVLRVWQFGSPMIIFLAGLRQIPSELYESASIDGASNTFAKFTRITLPILSPIILFNLIMQIISAFQAFTPAYIYRQRNRWFTGQSVVLFSLFVYMWF